MVELDGVFMDLYGTITTGDRDAVEGVCGDIVRDTGLDMTARELSVFWGERFFRYIDTCNGKNFKTLYEVEINTLVSTMAELRRPVEPEKYVAKLQHYWRNPPLQPEAKAFFDAFNFPVCIVSNADQADAEAVVKLHDLPVENVVTSEEARSYKPDPIIFDVAFERTGWRRDRVIHVGDSLHSDVGGAIAARIRSGWLNRSHRIHDIGNHDPDHEFDDLFGLSALLSQQQC